MFSRIEYRKNRKRWLFNSDTYKSTPSLPSPKRFRRARTHSPLTHQKTPEHRLINAHQMRVSDVENDHRAAFAAVVSGFLFDGVIKGEALTHLPRLPPRNFYRNRFDNTNKRMRIADHIPCQFNLHIARRHFGNQNLNLQLSQTRADAAVDTVAE